MPILNTFLFHFCIKDLIFCIFVLIYYIVIGTFYTLLRNNTIAQIFSL